MRSIFIRVFNIIQTKGIRTCRSDGNCFHTYVIITINTVFLTSAISSGIPKSNAPEQPQVGTLLSPIAPASVTVNAPKSTLVRNIAGFRNLPIRNAVPRAISSTDSPTISVCDAMGSVLFMVESRYSKKRTAAEASISFPTPDTSSIAPNKTQILLRAEGKRCDMMCAKFMQQNYGFPQTFSSGIE
jgi:hypothetical protein